MCFLRKPKVEPETIKPTSTEKATYTEVYEIIRDKFPEGDVYLSDKKYLLCAYDDIALFLAQDQTNKMGYVAEDLDCDDFSYRLMGQFSIPDWSALAFGIVWTSNHAQNCMIDQNKKFWFIEPQTDEISTDGVSDMRFIIM